MKRKWGRLVSHICVVSLILCMGMGNVVFAEEPVGNEAPVVTEEVQEAEITESTEQGGSEDPGSVLESAEVFDEGDTEAAADAEDGAMAEDAAVVSPESTVQVENASVLYSAHVQGIGWQEEKADGETAGTVGQNRRLEALIMNFTSSLYDGGIDYRAHVQGIGWQDWVSDGEVAGTTGQGRRVEAVQIKLTGTAEQYYDIYYRINTANFGWLGWAKNGEKAGTTGQGCAAEAIEVRLVEKGGQAPGSTADSYKPSLWQLAFEQKEESTVVAISPEALEEIIAQKAASKLVITATMNYNGQVTRKVVGEKSFSEIAASGFELDFLDYGKFTVSAQFIKNDVVVATQNQTVGVGASEYNIAPVSATFPVVLFSLSLWDINTNAAGERVPTIVMLGRPSAYNWDELPEDVYAMPYLTKDAIKSSCDYTAFAAYVRDLYAVSPNAKFHLYMNDIDCSYIHQVIYANQIPQGQYTITLMSDGSATYNIFNDTYSEANAFQKHQELIATWNNAKQSVYNSGVVGADWGWHSHWDCMYAVLSCEPGTQWWVARNNLFSSGDDAFTEQVKSDVTVKSVSTMLSDLQAKGDETVQEFKNLYNFNEGYFSEAETQGKQAMMILGTYVQNEVGFEDYARMTKLYYGDDYLYYYKGHPNTPTGMYPEKEAQLEELDITDVDSSVAAELILFFNPDISMSGYGSSTFNSASDEMACGLYNMKKANALSADAGVDYSGIDWFASPINKETVDEEIGKLCIGDDSYYLLEFSDSILEEGEYAFAVYNATKEVLTFYQKSGTGYEAVKVRSNESKISYRAHVASIGWQDYVQEGKSAGTVGEAKAVEALNIRLAEGLYSGSVRYQAHVQSIGWQDWVQDGEMAGTTGKAKRLEAVRLELTGEMAEHYDIYYRVQVQSFGWLDWAKNGEIAGTTGYAKRLETIQIKLVEKGGSAPGNTSTPNKCVKVSYKTHVQTYGWQGEVYDGALSGTTGQSKRLEAIQIKNIADVSGNIEYKTHIQTYGWEKAWSKNGELSGTTGESKRLEAIQIRLTGELAEKYDVYYRVHAQTYGWLDWAKNGEPAGTAGYAKRLEAIEIQYVEKGGAAPGETGTAYIEK